MANSPLVAIRLPVDLLERLDDARGDVDRSTWIRQVLEDRLLDAEKKALAEVVEYASRRGVTLEQLASFARSQKKK